jgi:hypothetical protein
VFDVGGKAPVGIGFFSEEHKLAIANSNRFGDSKGGLVLFDISKPSDPIRSESVPTGEFARNVMLSPDGYSLYVTNYTSRTLEVIAVPPAVHSDSK